MSKYTPAQKAAIKKYREKVSEIRLYLSNEKKTLYKEMAAKENVSLNQFILNIIDEYIKKRA
jgi:predicted HicB family RNase H-like nuclease